MYYNSFWWFSLGLLFSLMATYSPQIIWWFIIKSTMANFSTSLETMNVWKIYFFLFDWEIPNAWLFYYFIAKKEETQFKKALKFKFLIMVQAARTLQKWIKKKCEPSENKTEKASSLQGPLNSKIEQLCIINLSQMHPQTVPRVPRASSKCSKCVPNASPKRPQSVPKASSMRTQSIPNASQKHL